MQLDVFFFFFFQKNTHFVMYFLFGRLLSITATIIDAVWLNVAAIWPYYLMIVSVIYWIKGVLLFSFQSFSTRQTPCWLDIFGVFVVVDIWSGFWEKFSIFFWFCLVGWLMLVNSSHANTPDTHTQHEARVLDKTHLSLVFTKKKHDVRREIAIFSGWL